MPAQIATTPVYTAYLNEHPYTCAMLGALNQYGVKGLLHPDAASDLSRQKGSYNDLAGFLPTTSVQSPFPQTEFDFSYDGTYSLYNWEVFFHTVSLIARRLKENNKFAEAIRWLNYVFDPGDTDMSLNDLRYWQLKPFMKDVTNGSITNMMRLLSATSLTPADLLIRQQYEAQIAAWRQSPFDPHVIAGIRPRAYMLWTVMEYVTTLTDWGDYLFRQDTMESINEAINLYVIASEILGPRPKKIPRVGTPADRCFDDIEPQLSSFSNVLVAFENRITGLAACTCPAGETDLRNSSCGPSSEVTIVPTDLLFCVPDNPKLAEMWDRVDDRLFKIRHCMNIDGKKRELALFAPPIDPAQLVQAAAAGLSIADALADLSAPLPHYRFVYLLQKANEFNNEVKSLGSQLLGLLEKKDAEELSLFRQVHEQNILNAARALKQMAIDEAKQSYATLQSSKKLIEIRLEDYSARQYRNNREMSAMSLTRNADGFMYAEQGVRLIGGLLNLIPDFEIKTQGGTSGLGPHLTVALGAKMPFSGEKLSILANAGAGALSLVSSVLRNKASQSLTFASYDRRQEDWELQKKTAREELAQVDRQLLGAQIRIAVNEKELSNHDQQVSQSEEMYDWLRNKYTNGKLYSWMAGQVKSVYKQVFNLAYDMAKRAQICYDYELGKSTTNVIQYGQWDSSKSGFLAGERLSLQLKQLETEYINNNKREYELSKNISLALLDSSALEDLIVKGACTFQLPELLFDLDHPGQYFRRIKSVSISIPCIAGPNTNINAVLSLTKHYRRDTPGTSAAILDGLPIESIATSSAQNDSGVFELNFKDERYLPFEGRGAVSEWTLSLSQIDRTALSKTVIRQFDFNSISDVIMHVKYTANYDSNFSSTVGTTISNAIAANTAALSASGVWYALSLKHDLPNQWNEYKQTGTTNFKIEKNRLPYVLQAMSVKVTSLKFIVNPLSAITGSPQITIGCATVSLADTDLTIAPYAGSIITPTPYSVTHTFTTKPVLGTDIKIKEKNPLKANVDDIIVIAKIEVS